MEEMFANTTEEEFAHLTDLITSDGWRVFRKILKWRKGILSMKVIKETRLDNPEAAKKAVIALDEHDNIIKYLNQRIEITKPK